MEIVEAAWATNFAIGAASKKQRTTTIASMCLKSSLLESFFVYFLEQQVNRLSEREKSMSPKGPIGNLNIPKSSKVAFLEPVNLLA